MAIPQFGLSGDYGPDAVREVAMLTGGGNPQLMAKLGAEKPKFIPALTMLHILKQKGGEMPTQSIAQQAINPPPPQNPGSTGLDAINVRSVWCPDYASSSAARYARG